MIDLAKSVFMCDGRSVISSFQEKCQLQFGCCPEFRNVPCNGRDVSAEGYANAVYGTLLMALRSYFTSIVCVLDREQRRQSAIAFAECVKAAIIKKVVESTMYRKAELNEQIIICVPDTMFENWIVADVEGLKVYDALIKSTAIQQQSDGMSGATVLKRCMKVPYRKTIHAPKLFRAVSLHVAKTNSPSFNHLGYQTGLC